MNLGTVGDNQRTLLAIGVIILGICLSLALLLDSWKGAAIGVILFLTFTVAAGVLPSNRPVEELQLPYPDEELRIPPDAPERLRNRAG